MVEVSNAFKTECEANVGTYKFGKIKVNYIDDNPLNYEQGAYSSSDGTKIDAEQSIRYNKLVGCKPNFKYKIELGNSAYKTKIVTYTNAQAFIAAHDNLVDGNELTTEATAKYISVTIYSNDTLEGTSITLNSTIRNGEIAGAELKGNTTQASTPTPTNPIEVNNVTREQVVTICGKNLLNLGNGSTTHNGITTTCNNGEIIVNGTASANSFTQVALKTPIGWTNGTNYTISLNNPVANENVRFRVTSSGTYDTNCTNVNQTQTINYTTREDMLTTFINIRVASGTTLTNFKLKPQIEKGTSATSYEKYQGKDYEINLGKSIYEGSNDLYENIRDYSQFTREDLGENVLKLTKTTSGSTSPRFYVSLVQGKTYSVQLKAKGNCTKIEVGTWVDNTQTIQANIVPNENDFTTISFTFTYSGSNPRIYIRNNDTNIPLDTYIIIKDFMIEEGNQVTSYSPYFTPIELNKIGTYQDFIKKGVGKNLFDKDNLISGYRFGSDGELYANEGCYATEFINVKPNTTYATSWTIVWNMVVCLYDKDKHFTRRLLDGTNFTTTSEERYIRADVTGGYLETAQIEEGNTKTDYEPFGYKDKWYIEKNIDNVVLNGTETWTGWTSQDFTNTILVGTIKIDSIGKIANLGFCDRFSNSTNLWSVDTEGIQIKATGGNQVVIRVSKSVASDYTTFKTWLQSNNTKVYYVLATPTYTLIENEKLLNQLEAVSHAQTQEGISNILVSGDLPAILKVTPDLTESIRGKQTTPIVGYTITGDDDLINFKITSKADSNGNILGATSQSQVDIEIFNENNTHNLENKQVYISTGLAEIEGNYCKWQPFTITQTKDTQTKNHTTYTGYDDMMRGNEAYVDNIDYGEDGITLYDFTCNLAKEMGMALGNTTMTNGEFIVKGNNFTNNETKLVVLKNVAQMVGGFAMIDRGNLLRIVELSPEVAMTPIELTTNLYTEDFQNSAKFGEINEIAIGETNLETNAIVRSDEAAIAKDGVKKIEILDNLFLGMLADKELAIDPLWDAFEGFNYYPFKTPYNGYPYIDLGDKLNITDINSNVYGTMVLNHVFEYNGGYKGNIGAEALSITAAKYQSKNTLGKAFQKVGIDINRVEGKITQEVTAMSTDLTTAYSGAIETSENNIMGQVKTIQTTLYGPEGSPEEGLTKIVETHSTQIDETSSFVNVDIKNKLDTTYDMADAVTNNTKEIIESFNFSEDGMLITNKGSETADMSLLVSNAAIIFKHRGNNVLIINGEKIEFSAVSFQKLDLGNYVWQAEQDDSLSLIYEGGNS